MLRMTITQAIAFLVDKVIDMLDMKVIDKKQANEKIDYYKSLENNPMELKAELEKASRGKYTLKGSREATNISFAPKGTQSKYAEASSLVGSIDNFVRKVGDKDIEYTCGIYCKKVVKNKKKKKDDTK